MTKLQKYIISKLLEGYSIAASGSNGLRLRDPLHNPCRKIHPDTFYWLKRTVLRRTKNGLFVVNKNKVRQLHGNNYAKKEYKAKLNGTGNLS